MRFLMDKNILLFLLTFDFDCISYLATLKQGKKQMFFSDAISWIQQYSTKNSDGSWIRNAQVILCPIPRVRIPGIVQELVGWDLEKLVLVKGVLAHGREWNWMGLKVLSDPQNSLIPCFLLCMLQWGRIKV